jgi:hypothetical protein
MNQPRKRRISSLLLVVIAIATGLTAVTSSAESIRVYFTAEIGGIYDPAGYLPDEINVGDALVGYYVYDSEAPDLDANPHRGDYQYFNTPNGMVIFEDSGWVFRTDSSDVYVRFWLTDSLTSNCTGCDRYAYRSWNNAGYNHQLGGSLPLSYMGIELYDNSGTALENDELPHSAPDLSSWPDQQLLFIIGHADWTIYANLLTTDLEPPVGVRSRVTRQILLGQNYPNPFNPQTQIPFLIEKEQLVRISVYDVTGALVRTLINHTIAPGAYSVEWDGRDQRGQPLPSGIYFYRLQTTGSTVTRKSVLIK